MPKTNKKKKEKVEEIKEEAKEEAKEQAKIKEIPSKIKIVEQKDSLESEIREAESEEVSNMTSSGAISPAFAPVLRATQSQQVQQASQTEELNPTQRDIQQRATMTSGVAPSRLYDIGKALGGGAPVRQYNPNQPQTFSSTLKQDTSIRQGVNFENSELSRLRQEKGIEENYQENIKVEGKAERRKMPWEV